MNQNCVCVSFRTMIVNMPATTSGPLPNETLAVPTTSAASAGDHNSPTHCEYNILKRKYEGACTDGSISKSNTSEYHNSTTCSTTPVWKKRHLQETTGVMNDPQACYNSVNSVNSVNNTTTTTTTTTTTNSNYNIYNHTGEGTHMFLESLQNENVQNEVCVSTSATNTINNNNNINVINNNNNSNNNNNNNSNKSNNNNSNNINNNINNNNSNNENNMTFNLITGNSSFINDLFAYDANLIVPVTASLVHQSASNSISDSTLPAFATPSNVCVNTSYDDGSNWQATDLLELDHRYNSGLQTEIAHLHPTVSLKAMEESTLSVIQQEHTRLPQSQHTQQQQQQHQQTPNQTQFLVPEKQVSSILSNVGLNRYRPTIAGSSQTPQSQLSNVLTDQEADFEDKNLSWLLNFKFDEFPHLSPDLGGTNNNNLPPVALGNSMQTHNVSSPTSSSHKSNSCSPHSSSTQQAFNDYTRSPKSSTKAGRKFEELVMEVTAEVDGNDMMVAENVVVENSPQRA